MTAFASPDLFASVATPAVLIDRARLDRNLVRAAEHAKDQKTSLRPHIKTHRSVEIARRQVALSGGGIACAKVGEAEIFHRAGFDDIRIAYPVIGQDKLARIAELCQSGARISFVVDSEVGIRRASRFFTDRPELAEGRLPQVLLAIDSGYGREGVTYSSPEVETLAQLVTELPGLALAGLLTHAGQSYNGPEPGESRIEALQRCAADERDRTLAAARRLADSGRSAPLELSIGSTPTFWHFEQIEGERITELRPGNYAFHDLTQVALGACQIDDCAMTVLATVVSQRVVRSPGGETRKQFLIDAGKKTFTSDRRFGQEGYGLLRTESSDGTQSAHPDVLLENLSEEHGWLDAPATSSLEIGDRLRMLVNHSCVVTSTQDRLFEVAGDSVMGEIAVDARGAST